MERRTYTEIERTLKHSLTAIKRYILTFSRVAYLTEKGYTTKEIAFLVQVSERLTRDYQALYRKYKGDRAYKDQLDEILALNSVDREPCKGGDKLSMNTQQSIYAPLLDKTFVHDLGRSTTHKKIICEKSLRAKKATPDIAKETHHSPSAVDRYLGDFNRVRFCLKKGLLAPSPDYHSAIFCNSSFELIPNETTILIKSTCRQTNFLTERFV